MKGKIPSKRELDVLKSFYEVRHYWDGDPACLTFKSIAGRKKDMTVIQARRAVRALKRAGLVEHVRGLINDDGMLAGSGHAITREGIDIYESINGED